MTIRTAGRRCLATGVIVLGLAACSGDDEAMKTPAVQDMSSLSAADRIFISEAGYSGTGEVAMGRIAAERGSSQGVRAFGSAMSEQHGQMNAELANIAGRKGMIPPSAPDPGRQAVASMLSGLSGTEFDRQYLTQQMAEHQVALALFQSEASLSQDPDLKAFAAKHVADIEQHINMLRQMRPTTTSAN